MAATYAFLRDIRPYKTAWRIQVKVLHNWRQYTVNTGETLELVLADEHGMKIHGSVKKDLVNRYINHLAVGSWRFIETFSLTHAVGQFRPTTHVYKLNFVNGTFVSPCELKLDSNFLSLTKFEKIETGDFNPNILLDVLGQIVNIGDIETVEVNNKPTLKLEFEMRDERDKRMSCTLWGKFADQVFRACNASHGVTVVCVLRFMKVKTYKGVKYVSNSFDASQVHVNPAWNEVDGFIKSLPQDGLSLAFRETVPKFQIVPVKSDDCSQFPRKTISLLLDSVEVGKIRLMSTIYAIDTDWAWYYFSCRKCNKKVIHIHEGVNGVTTSQGKPKFWCDTCKAVVSNVIARYMLYVKVMDHTGETKFLLFDSIASEIIGESATSILGGSFDEIEDPENLPDPIKNVIGKTFAFLVCVERENIWDGKDSYRVSKILSKDGLLAEEVNDESIDLVNPSEIVSGDQVPLALTYSQDTTDSASPSSKRVYPCNPDPTEQSSTSKKVCAVTPVSPNSEVKFGVTAAKLQFEEDKMKDCNVQAKAKAIEDEKIKDSKKAEVIDDGKIEDTHVANTKFKGVQIKVEKK